MHKLTKAITLWSLFLTITLSIIILPDVCRGSDWKTIPVQTTDIEDLGQSTNIFYVPTTSWRITYSYVETNWIENSTWFSIGVVMANTKSAFYSKMFNETDPRSGFVEIINPPQNYQIYVTAPGIDDYTIGVEYDASLIPPSSSSSTTPSNWLQFVVREHSPVDILVTTPNGQQVGASNGATINEVQFAVYSGPGTSPQELIIPNPSVGNYSFNVFGTGTGNYMVTALSVASDGSYIDQESINGTISSGSSFRETFAVNQEGTLTAPIEAAIPEFPSGICLMLFVCGLISVMTIILKKDAFLPLRKT